MASSTKHSQALSLGKDARLKEIATLLDCPPSRVLDRLLDADRRLLAQAVLKPEEANRQLDDIQVLDQSQRIAEHILRYMEAKQRALDPTPRR